MSARMPPPSRGPACRRSRLLADVVAAEAARASEAEVLEDEILEIARCGARWTVIAPASEDDHLFGCIIKNIEK